MLNIYKITFKGYRGAIDSVLIAAHSEDFAIQCFKDCSEDEILHIEELDVQDGFILD